MGLAHVFSTFTELAAWLASLAQLILTRIRLSSDFNSNLFIFRLFCSFVGAHVMSLHLCSAFLVLLTTQNTINYNSHFNHTLIHCFIPSTSSTLFCLTSTTSFESPVNLTWMSLNCGRRRAKRKLKETPEGPERTRTLHTENLNQEL